LLSSQICDSFRANPPEGNDQAVAPMQGHLCWYLRIQIAIGEIMKAIVSRGPLALAALIAGLTTPHWVFAEEGQVIEELIVTARQRAETLQDVPVTVAVFTEEDLDRYNIRDLQEAAKLVPNFQISKGASGSGSNLYIRGVGSNSISAAFDQSVAINIDGIMVNQGRFIYDSYLDMGQLEVLKGPQSLYFGKSATAGVVSITSNDPTDEFELSAMVGYETEYEQTYTEFVVSGPIAENLGARFAFGTSRHDKMIENLAALEGLAADRWRDEESKNGRLTLLWEPSDTLTARLKVNYSEYESDGSSSNFDVFCFDGVRQPTIVPSNTVHLLANTTNDCKINGNTAIGDVNPLLRAGLPYGADDGKPFLEQESWLVSLKVDWDLGDAVTLTSVTGIVDFDHVELDNYSGSDAGVYDGLHRNVYESFSQEIRIASSFDGPLNFMGGIYYQDLEQTFEAYQYAQNIVFDTPGDPPGFGPDLLTGNAYDYFKDQNWETEVVSLFLAGYWNITDSLELTAGVRYTDETKDAVIDIPYMHYVLELGGFLKTGTRIDNLNFEDDNWSPEVALNYRITDSVSVYGSYKKGFKSGGIDTSALPTATLKPGADLGFLFFGSEEAEGFEIGVKSELLDGTMRLNATLFTYDYSDLQTQLFDSVAIQYSTFNASELRTEGAEFDLLWITPIEGLQIRSAWAYTDAKFTDTFINQFGEDLDGTDRPRSAEFAGQIGFTYDVALGNSGWRGDLSFDARFNDGYALQESYDTRYMDSFWLIDSAIRFYREDGRYELALIGRNLGDEIVEYGEQDIPATVPLPGGSGQLDHAVTTGFGRMFTLQFRVNL
jgi:iron complex outermembrane receptor protein